MLKVGDSVTILRSVMHKFKKYVGTIHIIEDIDENGIYLKDIIDTYDGENRMYYKKYELALVDNYDLKQDVSKLDNNTIALIKAMGMQVENKIRELNGEALTYNEQSFIDLIKKYEKEWFE